MDKQHVDRHELSERQKDLASKFAIIISRARKERRTSLTELEGLRMLDAMGIGSPGHHFVTSSAEYEALWESYASERRDALFPGKLAVVKVISPKILHKTEVGGVAIVLNDRASIFSSIAAMERKFTTQDIEGYTVNEFVDFEPKLGHEIIFGYRFTPDFGPVVNFGPGGIFTEFLAEKFKDGEANVFFSRSSAGRRAVEEAMSHNVVHGLVAGGLRGTKPDIAGKSIIDAVMTFLEAADAFAAAGVGEFEVNPMVIARRAGEPALVALDCLVTLADFNSMGLHIADDGRPFNIAQESRPVATISKILKPASAAIIGVSDKGMNNGRIILRNLLGNGFDSQRIYVIKPGLETIDGCRCVPDVASLPEKVDLFILVIPAQATPGTLAELASLDKAWSVIVIPGGFEEKSGSSAIVEKMRLALDEARNRGAGPLINGGNCLGIRSVPGKYNTLFIPEHKLPMPKGKVAPLAIISQSGAFSICRISKHPYINPKYVITCGNQMDLTIGDYLDFLKDDSEIRVFAVYVEGFKPLDGLKTLKACADIRDSGRSVIFYRAGRTKAGAGAAASHTASIAGDYPVTRELFAQAGAAVCSSLDEFDDAITLFTLLDGKEAHGNKFGAVSNAGFECVAIADNLGSLTLARFSDLTSESLKELFVRSRITEIVDVHNPLDITPMGDDDAYVGSFRDVLLNEGTDLGIVGIVPLSVMMNTLAPDPSVHGEDITRPDSIAHRYGALKQETTKPFVAVVDTGPLYDPLCRELENEGVPVFRTADRALRMLGMWAEIRSRSRNSSLTDSCFVVK
jgi:acyl-CoA synthetase (NDP forming)